MIFIGKPGGPPLNPCRTAARRGGQTLAMDKRTFTPDEPAAHALDPEDLGRVLGWIELVKRAGGWGVVTIELKGGNLYEVKAEFTDRDGAALNRLLKTGQ